MNAEQLIQYSSGRYYQYHGAITALGQECSLIGGFPLVLSDSNVMGLFGGRVMEALRDAGHTQITPVEFNEECSLAACRSVADSTVRRDVRSVMGFGGGKICDAAKIIADMLGLRCILLPTSAATCAATAWLAVEYRDDGGFVGNYWSRYSPFSAIVDLDFVYNHCPRRYLAAGIVDAIAKHPEISFNQTNTGLWSSNQFSSSAAALARHNYERLLADGPTAYSAVSSDRANQTAEDVIAICVSSTGLVSALACGGRQAAASHTIYSYVCNHAVDIKHSFLHGEIVGASLLYQLALNGQREDEVPRLRQALEALQVPLSLTDIGLNLSQSEREDMYGFISKSLSLDRQTALPLLGEHEYLLFPT